MTASENAPRNVSRVMRTASTRPTPPASADSTRWATTSVSVSDSRTWPPSRSSLASSHQFSTMPLWTTAIVPVQSV